MPPRKPKPPTDPPPAAKHKARRSTFAAALADAEKRLAQALAQKETAVAKLIWLAVEIPRLQGIISALGGTSEVAPLLGGPSMPNEPWLPVASRNDIPDGAGSIPVNADGTAQPAAAPDLDSLPGMAGGGWK